MSVSTTTNRAEYVGNGVQTTFPYPYKIFAQTDLQVYVAGVLQTITTHYTVTGAGNESGGDVVFLTAPANAATVLILRVLPSTQETVYPSNDKFPAKVHEGVADRAVMLIQQLQETDQRALKLSTASLYKDLTLADPTAGKFLRYKSDLSGVEGVDITTLGSLGLPVSTADGGTGASTPLGARQNLGLDGTVVKQFTNRTGGTVNSGDVVALSTANDDSVVLGDTAGSKQSFAVALETISNLAVGKFLVTGIADVAVQGACARGQFIKKSATSLKIEDAGAAHGAAVDPPAGTLGYTIGAVSGGKARTAWFGHAVGASITLQKAWTILLPISATFGSANFPQLVKNVGTNFVDYTLDFDKDTSEAAYWVWAIPLGGPAFTGCTIEIFTRQASATAGNHGFRITTRRSAMGDGAAWDTAGTTDATTFDAVQGTAGRITKLTKTLTVAGWALGDLIQIKIDRDAANASDTLAEDAKFIGAVIRLT